MGLPCLPFNLLLYDVALFLARQVRGRPAGPQWGIDRMAYSFDTVAPVYDFVMPLHRPR